MPKYKKMDWDEWKKLGDAFKDFEKAKLVVSSLMNEEFPKSGKMAKLYNKVDKAIGELRSKLDDEICALPWPEKRDDEVTNVFYGLKGESNDGSH